MKIKFNIYLKLGLGVKAIVAWEQETVKRRKSQKKQAWLWIVIIEPAFIGEGFPFSVFVIFALCVNGIADALAHFLCADFFGAFAVDIGGSVACIQYLCDSILNRL